jgi:hypothetical protein
MPKPGYLDRSDTLDAESGETGDFSDLTKWTGLYGIVPSDLHSQNHMLTIVSTEMILSNMGSELCSPRKISPSSMLSVAHLILVNLIPSRSLRSLREMIRVSLDPLIGINSIRGNVRQGPAKARSIAP